MKLRLYRPVNDIFRVSLGYQSYPAFIMKLTGRKYHYGIDFACPIGTKVSATIGGIVIVQKHHPEFGNLVIVESRLPDDPTAIYTLYAHLFESAVEVDQRVDINTTIGRSGATGIVSGAHLHFELRVGGYEQRFAVDPRPYMKSRTQYA